MRSSAVLAELRHGDTQSSHRHLGVPDPLDLPAQVSRYPELRYMGSKKRLLPWINQVMAGLDFQPSDGGIGFR
jgi:hypothetical protein